VPVGEERLHPGADREGARPAAQARGARPLAARLAIEAAGRARAPPEAGPRRPASDGGLPMRHHRQLAVLALLALSACTAREDVGPSTTVTCGSASECPGGRVCNRARCVNPDAIDTTPPDLLAGSVVVSPSRVRAGQVFTVSLQVSEALEAPPQVSLGLVPPVLLDCSATSSVAYACAHTATGHENGDLGGDIAVDVRMRDLAGNDTARSSVATVTFDFAPPSPTIASVAYDPAPSNPLASVTMATAGTRVRVAVSADERLSASAPPSLQARLGAATLPFALAAGGLGDVDAVFATTVPAGQLEILFICFSFRRSGGERFR